MLAQPRTLAMMSRRTLAMMFRRTLAMMSHYTLAMRFKLLTIITKHKATEIILCDPMIP